MTSAATRVWTFATAFAIVIVVALGWFLGIAPKLAEMTRFESERVTVELQNNLNRIALAQIQDDFARINEFRAQLDAVAAEFPEMPEYDEIAETLFAEMLSAGLVLENLTISEPEPASPEAVVDEFGQLPRGTLVEISIVMTVYGDVLSALEFIDAVQRSERLSLVTGFVHVEGRYPVERRTSISLSMFVVTGTPVEGALPISGAPLGETPPPATEESAVEG